MDMMIHAKFHFNWLMLTLIFGIRASEPPPPPGAWRTTEKAGPDRVNLTSSTTFIILEIFTTVSSKFCHFIPRFQTENPET